MGSAKAGIDAETICHNLKEPVFFLDADLTFAFANERFFDITQLSRRAVIGQDCSLLRRFMQDDFETFREAAEQQVTGEDTEERRVDIQMHHPEDAPVDDHLPAEARLVLVDRAGTTGLLVVLRDVSDRAAYERQLEERTEQLLVLNRLLRHDISNDIAVIEGWAELLAEQCEGSARDLVERIRTAATHIRELTREVSGVLTLFQEEGEMKRKPMPLMDVLEREVEKIRSTYPDATIELSDERDRPDSVHVLANDLLSSVFTNVITNAIRHNDRDSPTVEIDVSRRNGTATVRISDDGPGIPDERKEAILTEDRQRLNSRGSGIGLYLVTKLVDEFGGDISISDSDPRGSVVTIELPIVDQ